MELLDEGSWVNSSNQGRVLINHQIPLKIGIGDKFLRLSFNSFSKEALMGFLEILI